MQPKVKLEVLKLFVYREQYSGTGFYPSGTVYILELFFDVQGGNQEGGAGKL